ncbi:MAG TPA: transglutaminase-like domain-containing protein, partial [Bacteroidales bacterium]
MSNHLNIGSITSGYRPIRDGRPFDRYFAQPEERDRIIIEDGEVEQTVDLMKRVVWKYIDDTKRIAQYLKGRTLLDTCENIWNFLYNHIQYRLDKRGLEQLRRPNRSWTERRQGIDCDCFSIFVSSILTNLKVQHSFRITKYDKDVFQHVYVIVPQTGDSDYIIIDCVLNRFNYEKPFTEKKDFAMSLNGINVAVLSGTETNDVMELVSGLDDRELLGSDNETARLEAIYEHLVKTRNMIAAKPELINSVDYPPAFLKMLDYAIDNWNTPNRDKALEILSKNEDAINRLNGFEGTFEELEGIDDDFVNGLEETNLELNGKKRGIKGFFKKVGEAAKKGGKLFIRFNPVTIAARGGFLLAMKIN